MKTSFKIFLEIKTSKLEQLKNELRGIESSSDFKRWMRELSGGSDQTITREKLISGFCEDLAVYLHYKYGAEIFKTDDKELKDGHYFVKFGSKFYDAMDPEGYSKPSQSVWSERLMKQDRTISPDMIDKHLKPYDWNDTWTVYKTSKKVIDPA